MESIDLENKLKKLYNEKYECELNMKLIEKEIKNTKYNISKVCLDKNKGHDWVSEREEGPYGERFTYCSKCRIDYYGDHFHY